MKLAALYNAWDGCELLPESIKTIHDHVDLIVIIYQEISNFGEAYNPLPEIEFLELLGKVVFVKYEPNLALSGAMNETAKRNLGLQFAKANHCSQFISMDVDELYSDFGVAKKMFLDSGCKGSVVRLKTYFKKPIFMFDIPEDYYVPFIHRLDDDTKSGMSSYPFWVDPTRTINTSDVKLLPIFMHHFSWVRKDIDRKVRNSSSIGIIKNSTIMQDYHSPNLGEGYLLKNWARRIKIVPDTFGLNKIFE